MEELSCFDKVREKTQNLADGRFSLNGEMSLMPQIRFLVSEKPESYHTDIKALFIPVLAGQIASGRSLETLDTL